MPLGSPQPSSSHSSSRPQFNTLSQEAFLTLGRAGPSAKALGQPRCWHYGLSGPTGSLCRRPCPVLLVGLVPTLSVPGTQEGPVNRSHRNGGIPILFRGCCPFLASVSPPGKGGGASCPMCQISLSALFSGRRALRSRSIPFWFPGSHASVHTDCRRV